MHFIFFFRLHLHQQIGYLPSAGIAKRNQLLGKYEDGTLGWPVFGGMVGCLGGIGLDWAGLDWVDYFL